MGTKDADSEIGGAGFGGALHFVLGTGNSLFAQAVANQTQNGTVSVNSDFGVIVSGQAEFVGDSWEIDCQADLSQVWSDVRSHVSAGVSFGFFSLGASYDSIVQSLVKNHKINCTQQGGSLDTAAHGQEVLDLGKTVFEQINKQAAAGDGFFKFEPNTPAQTPGSGGGGGIGSPITPWSVSVNVGYSSSTFNQHITWSSHLSYTGHFKRTVYTGATIALQCNDQTQNKFRELNSDEPCVTSAKSAAFQSRLDLDVKAKAAQLAKWSDKFDAGKITFEQYMKIFDLYQTTSVEDGLPPALANNLLSESSTAPASLAPAITTIGIERLDAMAARAMVAPPVDVKQWTKGNLPTKAQAHPWFYGAW
jgi:hypothetical protein